MKPILEINQVSKSYRLGQQCGESESLREYLSDKAQAPLRVLGLKPPKAGHRLSKEPFWALSDVTFEVAQGDVVGIIGRNGAGKSTLLKIASRITRPTRGSLTLRGRLASLLEVGTGFHPELTGRENIFLNGAILGMRKTEIVSKFDEIVAFAEIEKFLDTPVKHYSSGMYVRLAFAVAAHLEPEILIVDEVLAVGDTAFQKKCLGKMQQVSSGGRTVLFVSHNLAAVENLCQRGVVLERGKVVYQGSAKDAVRKYTHDLFGQQTAGSVFDLAEVPRLSRVGKFLKRVELFSDGNVPVMPGIRIGESLQVHIHFELPKLTSSFNIGLGFNDLTQQRIFTAHSFFEPNHGCEEREGLQVMVCEIPSFTLMPGEYSMRLWLDIGGTEADLIEDAAQLTVLESDYYGTGKAPWNGAVVLPHNWRLKPAGRNSSEQTAEGRSVAVSG